MKNLLLTFLLISAVSNGISQTKVKANTKQNVINSTAQFLIPYEDKFILEKYTYFKYQYWLHYLDTLSVKNETILVGKDAEYQFADFLLEYDICDSLVNTIRNSQIYHRNHSRLSNEARVKIGYGNKEFEDGLGYSFPDDIKLSTICSDQFVQVQSIWYSEQLTRIDRIYSKKQERLKEIENSDEILETMIKDFLRSYHNCPTDFQSMIKIIEKSPENFLKVAEELGESDFNQLLWSLKDISKEYDMTEARKSFISLEAKSTRKNKIKRKLGK